MKLPSERKQPEARGPATRRRSGGRLLKLILLPALLLATTASSAAAQGSSASPAKSAEEAACREIRRALSAALDKIERLNAETAAAAALVKEQDGLVSSLERRDEFRLREIDALKRAQAATEELREVERRRADLAEARVKELERSLEAARKRNKWGFFIGVAAGAALALGL